MPGTSSLFDFILQLLANPALAQSFLSDPDGTFDGVDLNQTDITIVASEINNAASLLNSSGVASIAIPALLPGTTGGQLLDSFVTSFYADHPTTSNVWADDDVTQAFAGEDGVAVAGGEEVEHVTAATGGSIAVSGEVEESGFAIGGSIAAGGDVEFEENGDITIGDGNVAINGNDNDVVGGDQIELENSPGANVATNGSWIQNADGNGMNAGGNALRDNNIAGDDLAIGGSIAADGNVADAPDAIATNGPVADGNFSQAAGEDSNQVKDDDSFSPTINQTAPVTMAPITQGTGAATSGASGASGRAGDGGATGDGGASGSSGDGGAGGNGPGGDGASATSGDITTGPVTSGSSTGGAGGSATGGDSTPVTTSAGTVATATGLLSNATATNGAYQRHQHRWRSDRRPRRRLHERPLPRAAPPRAATPQVEPAARAWVAPAATPHPPVPAATPATAGWAAPAVPLVTPVTRPAATTPPAWRRRSTSATSTSISTTRTPCRPATSPVPLETAP